MSRNLIWLVGVLLLCGCGGGASQSGRAAVDDKKPDVKEIDIHGV
jgi:hypothetical protein